jgi:hypothetical protein
VVVVTANGTVTNAGIGIANSGLNLAIGNISTNDADADQDVDINDALLADADGIVGQQVASNAGGATNNSNGRAKVGSGNATAVGNLSTTDVLQAAAVDSDLAIANLDSDVDNLGFGLANSGLNLGIGNASTNSATLDQDADGAGVVSNAGTASNDSDGTAEINPEACEEEKVTPPAPKPEQPKAEQPGQPGQPGRAGQPGAASLPRTGGAIEAQAAIALMLLLAGFGLRRRGQKLA